MKTHTTNKRFLKVVTLALLAGLTTELPAATVYWDADADGTNNVIGTGAGLGGAGSWNNSLSGTPLVNWWPGSGTTDQTWVDANVDSAVFWGGTAGTVTLTDPVTVGAMLFKTTGYTIAGSTLTFAGATPTLTNDTGISTTLTSILTGSNGVTVAGGTFTINNASNTLSGGIKINSGTLTSTVAGSFGTNLITLNGGTYSPRANLSNDILVTANSTINVTGTGSSFTLGAFSIGSQTLSIQGDSSVSNGNVIFGATTLTGNATISLNKAGSALAQTSSNATFGAITVGNGVATATTTTFSLNSVGTGVTRARQMTLNGILSDNSVDATKILALNVASGAATPLTVNVAAANTYSGSTTVSGGNNTSATLRLTTGNDRLPTGTVLTVNGGATGGGVLDLNTFNQTVAGLNGGSGTIKGLVTNNAAGTGTATLTVSSTTVSSSYAGSINDGATAKVALTKAGAGTSLTLSGVNTYSGATSINAGTLLVTGSINNSTVTVANGGTLGGSGSSGAVIVQAGGTLAPGNSPGTFTSSSLTLNGGANYQLQLMSDGTGTAGTDWDSYLASGALDITALSSGNTFVFKLETLVNATTPGLLGSWDGSLNHTWANVIDFGSLTGTYAANLFSIDASAFANAHPGTFSIVQNGTAFDLQYTAAVPEPSTYALFGLGLASLYVLRRRKILVG